MLSLSIFIIFLYCLIIPLYKTCLNVTSNACLLCSYDEYDLSYVTTFHSSANVIGSSLICKFKTKTVTLQRNILIINPSIICLPSLCSSYASYDASYDNLAKAFEAESQISSIYLYSYLHIYIQEGTYYIHDENLTSIGEELFRRSLVSIIIEALDEDIAIISLKSNKFYLYISNSVILRNIVIEGNDIAVTNEASIYAFYGLFNIEYIFDASQKPYFQIFNCTFRNFNITDRSSVGFLTIIALTSYSGSVYMNNVTVYNNCLSEGFIMNLLSYYDFSNIMQTLMKDIPIEWNETIYITDLRLIDDKSIIYINLIDWNGTLCIYNSSIMNNNTIFISWLNVFMKGYLELVNITYNSNYFQVVLLNAFYVFDISMIDMNGCTIANVKNSLIYIYYSSSLYISNFTVSNSYIQNISLIDLYMISNITIYNLYFNDIELNTIFSISYSNYTSIYNSSFIGLIFSNTLIFTSNTAISIYFCIFNNITGGSSLIYSFNTNTFFSYNLIINEVNISYVYDLNSLMQTQVYGMQLRYSNMLYIFKASEQVLNTTLISSTVIYTSFYSLFINYHIPKTSLYLIDVQLLYNRFNRSIVEILITNIIRFQHVVFIENYIVDPEAYEYMLCFGKSDVIVSDSYFESNGITQIKKFFMAVVDDSLFYCWMVTYCSIRNVTVVLTSKIQLINGVVNGVPLSGVFEFIGGSIIMMSYRIGFQYKGIYLNGFKSALITNSNFHGLMCNDHVRLLSYGGILLTNSANRAYVKNNIKVVLTNNQFYGCSCNVGAGLVVISISQVYMENCSFYNSSSDAYGGNFALISGETHYLKNIFCYNSTADEGSGIYIYNILSLTIDNISISYSYSRNNGVLYMKKILHSNISNSVIYQTYSKTNGGFLCIVSSGVRIENSSILNVMAEISGGVIYLLENSNLYMHNISVFNCSANTGGFLNVDDSNLLVLIDVSIYSSYGSIKGGAMLIAKVTNMTMINLYIQDSYIFKGVGVISIEVDDDTAVLTYNNITCYRTYAAKGSCLYYLSSAYLQLDYLNISYTGPSPMILSYSFLIQSHIYHVNIENVISNASLVSLSFIGMDINDWRFINNQVYFAFIDIQSSSGQIVNIYVANNSFYDLFDISDSEIYLINLYVSSLAFATSKSSNLYIYNTCIIHTNNSLSYVFSAQTGNISFTNVSFINSMVQAIILSGSPMNLYIYNSFFHMNRPKDISFENSWIDAYNIYIENSVFDVFYQVSLVFKGPLNLSLNACIFINYNQDIEVYAIDILNLYAVSIYRSIFKNFTDSSIKILTDITFSNINIYFTLNHCNFISNRATLGSSILAIGSIKLLVNETLFLNNIAYMDKAISNKIEGIAPTIYYQPICRLPLNCDLSIYSCNFSHNYAFYIGSTVFSQNSIITNKLYNNTFDDNIDGFNFTNAFFSFPLDIEILSYEYAGVIYNTSNQSTIINIVSGNNFKLYLRIVDFFQVFVNFDNSTIFSLKTDIIYSNTTILLQNNMVTAYQGIIAFENLMIATSSNFTFNLTLEAEFIGISKASSQFITPQKIHKTLTFHTKTCSIGEILSKDLSCKPCLYNSFSLIDPMTTPIKYQKCFICPMNALCDGRASIMPLENYYRKDANSDNVVACIVQGVCLGSNQSNNNISYEEQIHGVCNIGNQGPLCYYCTKGFGKTDEGDYCKSCNEMMLLVYGRIALIVSLVIFYILLNAKFTETSNKKKGTNKYERCSVFLKILINHSQHISILSLYINYTFPTIDSLVNLTQYISFSTDYVLNNDCWLQDFYDDFEHLFLVKIIFNNLLPLLTGILSFLSWLLFFFAIKKQTNKMINQKTFENFKIKFVFFLVFSTFIFYPLIVKSCLNLLKCINLSENDSLKYMKEGPLITCFEGIHIIYITSISLTGFLFWGLCFPIGLIYILATSLSINNITTFSTGVKTTIKLNENTLKSNKISPEKRQSESMKLSAAMRQSVEDISVKRLKTYAFFYKGFKREYFYWESLIFIRKFVLIFFSTINDTNLQEMNRGVLFMIFGVFFYLTMKLKPYNNDISNKMDIFSLFACIITVFASGITNSGMGNTSKTASFLICVMINIAFYLFVLFCLIFDLYNVFKKSKRNINCKSQVSKQVMIKKFVKWGV